MKAIYSLLILSLLFCVPFVKSQEDIQAEPDFPEADQLREDEVPPPPEYEEEPVDESAVQVLTEATFDAALKLNKYILVEFYAPWCGHCKELAPQYARAAQSLLNRETPIALAKVDATTETKLAEKYEVQGYPTLKFFVDGEPMDYTGGRTELEIILWIDKKTGPIVKEINTMEDLDILKTGNDVVAVLFNEPGENDSLQAFKKVAYEFDDVIFGLIVSEELRTELKLELNSLIVYKKFDERTADCNCEINEDNIRNFIDRHQFPLVMTFNDRAAEKIFGEGTATLFLFGKSQDEEDKALRQVFTETAERLRGKILLCVSYFSDDLGQRLAEYIGLTPAEVPVLKIISPTSETGEVKKFAFEGTPTVEGLVLFYEEFSAGKIQPYYRSEAIPESNDRPVKVVVGKTFNEIVMDSTKDVLVEFYAPWCGHCKQLAPIYESVAKKLAGNTGVVIANCDATANEIEGVAIEGFPTLKFYPANNKVAVDFDGERTEESIIDFLKNHATVPWVEVPKKEDL